MKTRKLVARDIEGGWLCRHWRILYEDGTYTEPFGADLSGLLIYSADGHMSACIMAGGRRPFRAANPRAATKTERAAAFDGYFSYAGHWRIKGGAIEHRVTVALNPAFVGTRQWRNAELSANRLVLSADEVTSQGIRRHEIEWYRPRRRIRS